jgi:hypothetical protein
MKNLKVSIIPLQIYWIIIHQENLEIGLLLMIMVFGIYINIIITGLDQENLDLIWIYQDMLN